jgi:signal peptidase
MSREQHLRRRNRAVGEGRRATRYAPAVREVVTWAVRAVLVGLVVLGAAAVGTLVVLPAVTGSVALEVLTGSMNPAVPAGSVVLVRPVDPATLRVGDVATYQTQPGRAEYITHRIVGIDSTTGGFTFQGDANRGPDKDVVPAAAVRGRVWFHAPYLGTVRHVLQDRGSVAGLGIVLLSGYALVQLVGGLAGRRRDGVDASPEAAERTPPPTRDSREEAVSDA